MITECCRCDGCAVQNGHKRGKVRTATPDNGPAGKVACLDTSSQAVRRSSRHHRVRGEIEVDVSSNDTLRDLKVKLMRLAEVPTYDQHLVFNGNELTGNDKVTLGSLQLLPGSVIYLWVSSNLDLICGSVVTLALSVGQ